MALVSRFMSLPRAAKWNLIINTCIVVGALIVIYGVISDIAQLINFISDSGEFPFWVYNVPGFLGLFLDAWVIRAAVKFRRANFTRDPNTWMPFSRFRRFLLFALSVLGLPAARGLYSAGEIGGALTILKILFIPIVLPILGALNFLVLFLVFAIPIGIVYFLVTGLPIIVAEHVHTWVINRHIKRAKERTLVSRVARFSLWLTGQPMPAPPPDDSKGARFSTDGEIIALYRQDGAGFGHIGGAPLLLHTDKHVLIMASTRSGKGVALIIPHLLRYHGSAFVLDPKGENARATGRRRGQINNKVRYLDPFGISGKTRSRFNPLSRFTPDNMEAESKALATALVIGERDHWTASAQQLLAAVILHVFTVPTLPPEKKDLVTVRRLLLGALPLVLKEMSQSEAADGLVAALAQSFIDTPEREFGSILSTAQRETEILDNPFISACLSAAGEGEEVDFADWHKGTMTVYLCLSAPKFPVFNRWLRLVLTSALDEMTDRLRPPPLPVCFMLDELATLGHLATVENAVGLAAGYGVQLVTVFQDVAQMRDLYKGRWASFIGNAGVRALFNLDDFETAEYWSKFLGGHLVETTSQSQDIYGLTHGENVGETVRPLLSPDAIMMQFAAGKMLILPQGSHPIVADRVAYFDDKQLDGLWDDPRVEPPRGNGSTGPSTPPPPPPTPPPESPKAKPKPARPPDDEPPRPPRRPKYKASE